MERILIGAHADRRRLVVRTRTEDTEHEQEFVFLFDESVGPSLLATLAAQLATAAAADAAILERMAS